MTLPNIGLVLEGGGMRGVFTSGVVDYLLDAGLRFPYCVSVSAGAGNGLCLMSRQRGRAKVMNIDMMDRHRFIGLKYIWSQHSILDRDLIYNKIPNEMLPFDYDACFANPMAFEMVTTDCQTGRALYLSERSDRERLIAIAQASSSLPFVCPMVTVDGRKMLDGGIVDSIPVERAIECGFPRNVVVLTRNRGYRSTGRDIRTPKFIYPHFPRLCAVLSRRNALYNRQLELVERLEDEGRIIAIRPSRPLEVERLTADTAKLTALYLEGYECACRALKGDRLEHFVAT